MSCATILGFVLSFSSFAGLWGGLVEEGYLDLRVKDVTGKSVRNIGFKCQEGCAFAPSDDVGRVHMKLPPQVRSDSWILLQVVNQGQNWVLISPWNFKLNVPSFNPTSITEVTVARKGDRQILGSGKAVEAITARILNQLRDKLNREYAAKSRDLIAAERKQVLKEQAEAVGLTPEEVDQAIRDWAQKAQDPYQRGLGALYSDNYPEAEKLLTESRDIRKRNVIKAKSDYADACFFLANALAEQYKYGEAVESLKEADDNRPDDLKILGNLGVMLGAIREYEEANRVLHRALEIAEKEYEPIHANRFKALADLAVSYEMQGRYADAEPFYKRALGVIEKLSNPDYSHWALTLGNFAHLYYEQERYAEAEPLYLRALKLLRSSNNLGGFAEAWVSNGIAMLYARQKQYTKADFFFKRALAIKEQKSKNPDDDLDIALGLINLATFYSEQEKYFDAEPLIKRALAIREKALGPEHPDIAPVLNDLAQSYFQQKQYAKAEPLLKRILAIKEKALSSLYADNLDGKPKTLHPSLAEDVFNLATAYREQKKYTDAEALLIRFLLINQMAYGDEHPQVAFALYNLGSIYDVLGKYDESVRYFESALGMAEKVFGPDETEVADILEDYASTLRKMKREEGAIKLETRAKEIRQKRKRPKEND